MKNNDNSPKNRAFSKDRPARNGGNGRAIFPKKRAPRRDGEEKEADSNEKRSYGERKTSGADRPKRSYTRKSDDERGGERRSYTRKSDDGRGGEKRSYTRKTDGECGGERRSYTRKSDDERGGERRSYTRKSDDERGGERRSYTRKSDDERGGERRSYTRKSDDERGGERRSYTRKSDDERGGERRSYTRRSDDERGGERRSYTRKSDDGRGGERRSYTRKSDDERGGKRRSYTRKSDDGCGGERRSFSKGAGDRGKRSFSGDRDHQRSFSKPDFDVQLKRKRRRDVTADSEILSEIVEKRRCEGRPTQPKVKIRSLEYEEQYTPVRLNKYISNAGVCSRREADTLIVAGAIMVNGEVVTELGFKVNPTDEVRFGDKILQREKPVYVLLNKPKDYITTMYDEFDRKDVMELVRGACKERIYPVGRLDRDTTGLLLFTNDGEMTKKLTHPKNGIKKIYHVSLDKNLKAPDFEAIMAGLEFDDDVIIPDELAYIGNSKSEIGITIHSGKNRIIRRIFESLGYQVEKLDRVIFAGLTKKDLPRGNWRFLTQAEINILKMIK